MAIVSALWLLAAGYGSFAMRRVLQTSRTDAIAHRRQAEQLARDGRQKQATVALAKNLRVETPESAGAPEGADALTQMAKDSGVTIESLRMTTENHAQAAPAANNAPNAGAPNAPPAIPNGVNPAVGANQGSGVISGANPNAAKDPDDGWKKAKFTCMALGSFRDLTTFLNKMDNAPYVMEIVGADMTRDHYDLKTGELRLRLNLTLMLYGLPKNSR